MSALARNPETNWAVRPEIGMFPENVSRSEKEVCDKPPPIPILTVCVSLYPNDTVGTTVENPTFEE